MGELVASLALTNPPPPNSGQVVGEQMNLRHHKTKLGLGKKKKK